MNDDLLNQAARIISSAKHLTVFTGAGISVESGIPSFRGANGLWNNYDPSCLDIGYFKSRPERSWPVIREIFYDHFGKATPNFAHKIIAEWETHRRVKCVITQNIDNLHTLAGSRIVWEFHGNSRNLVCLKCGEKYPVSAIDLGQLPPGCGSCGGLLKPDFVFFGESIPEPARTAAFEEANKADVFLLIGTSGEVMPACAIPFLARQRGAAIVEINPEPSRYTDQITDVYLQGGACAMMELVNNLLSGRH